jgi:hypothetical protein
MKAMANEFERRDVKHVLAPAALANTEVQAESYPELAVVSGTRGVRRFSLERFLAIRAMAPSSDVK